MQNNINIDYLLQNMPEDIYQTMLDYNKNDQIKSLTIALGLSETATSIFFQEISNVLMGIKNIEDFKNILITQLNLNETSANFAVSQLNSIVFNALKDSILYMQDIYKKWVNNGANNIINTDTQNSNTNNKQESNINQSYEQNVEQILNVIKNLSQKQVSNPSAVISEPIIVQEAAPNITSNETKTINNPSVSQSFIPNITPDETKTISPQINTNITFSTANSNNDKPNKLLEAMQKMQSPKTKIDDLIQSYRFNTNTNPQNNNMPEQHTEDTEFESPFKIKKTPSIIQKGESDISNNSKPTDINPTEIPDILKMKKTREPISPSIKNIELESAINTPNISQTPIKYTKVVPEEQTKPYQYEQGTTNTAQTKFIDLTNA